MFKQGAVAGAIAGGVYGAFSDRTTIMGGAMKGAAMGGMAGFAGPGMKTAYNSKYASGLGRGAREVFAARTGVGMASHRVGKGWSDVFGPKIVSNGGKR